MRSNWHVCFDMILDPINNHIDYWCRLEKSVEYGEIYISGIQLCM